MRFLITNDDGIEAPGLAALVEAAKGLGRIVVVAPAGPQSGCSHSVTTQGPLRVETTDRGFAVHGTPADCVRLALHTICPDVDWVLAGINAGGNLGADVYHSGTVAAVREGVLHGKPGIAVSQYRKRDLGWHWDRAASWTGGQLPTLLARPARSGRYWNVNLPNLRPEDPDPEALVCPLDPAPLPLEFRAEGDLWHYCGEYHTRRRKPGCDVNVCFSGKVSVTPIDLY